MFDRKVVDTYTDPNHGYYPQVGPSLIKITFSASDVLETSTTFQSDSTVFPHYFVKVENDVDDPIRDNFHWSASDPDLAKELGYDEVQANMTLTDSSASVFSDDTLPSDLNMEDFEGRLFLLVSTNEGNVKSIHWIIKVKIDDIEKR
jgi:hypothetical protein